jgi:hypothetical protein
MAHLIDQLHDVLNFLKPTRQASRHSRGDFQALVNADEVITHEVQRHGVDVVFDLL